MLYKGRRNIGRNMTELMKPAQSLARRKAIATIARRRGVSKGEAQAIQARAIASSQAKKR